MSAGGRLKTLVVFCSLQTAEGLNILLILNYSAPVANYVTFLSATCMLTHTLSFLLSPLTELNSVLFCKVPSTHVRVSSIRAPLKSAACVKDTSRNK